MGYYHFDSAEMQLAGTKNICGCLLMYIRGNKYLIPYSFCKFPHLQNNEGNILFFYHRYILNDTDRISSKNPETPHETNDEKY